MADAHERTRAATFVLDRKTTVGSINLPAGEYPGFVKETGIEMADGLNWTHQSYSLEIGPDLIGTLAGTLPTSGKTTTTDITSLVTQGLITVR